MTDFFPDEKEIASEEEFEQFKSVFLLPQGAWEDERNLLRLPDGRYVPSGLYAFDKNEVDQPIIYEPRELNFMARLAATMFGNDE